MTHLSIVEWALFGSCRNRSVSFIIPTVDNAGELVMLLFGEEDNADAAAAAAADEDDDDDADDDNDFADDNEAKENGIEDE